MVKRRDICLCNHSIKGMAKGACVNWIHFYADDTIIFLTGPMCHCDTFTLQHNYTSIEIFNTRFFYISKPRRAKYMLFKIVWSSHMNFRLSKS